MIEKPVWYDGLIKENLESLYSKLCECIDQINQCKEKNNPNVTQAQVDKIDFGPSRKDARTKARVKRCQDTIGKRCVFWDLGEDISRIGTLSSFSIGFGGNHFLFYDENDGLWVHCSALEKGDLA